MIDEPAKKIRPAEFFGKVYLGIFILVGLCLFLGYCLNIPAV